MNNLDLGLDLCKHEEIKQMNVINEFETIIRVGICTACNIEIFQDKSQGFMLFPTEELIGFVKEGHTVKTYRKKIIYSGGKKQLNSQEVIGNADIILPIVRSRFRKVWTIDNIKKNMQNLPHNLLNEFQLKDEEIYSKILSSKLIARENMIGFKFANKGYLLDMKGKLTRVET
jgi:hypothetical protein